jgi:type I restriction enzyme S subunit
MKQYKYQRYKPSGVEWIGDIPESWNSLKLKHEYKIQKGKIPKIINEKEVKGLVPYLSMDVLRGSEISGFVNVEDGIFVKEGQTLILWDGSNSGEIIKVEKEGVLSSTMGVLNKIGNKLNEDFSFYQLKSYEPEIRNNTNGMGIPHVDGQYVRSLVLLTPPLQEQEQIVNYLDEKTTIIDKLISTKQRKVELLKEQRTTLINQVITKGLNPNVKMKDSGVEWIGEIPEYWNNTILRYYVNKVGSGVTPRGGSEVYVDEGVIFIRSQNVHFEGLKLEDISRITIDTHNGMNGSKVSYNDLLLNITGGSIGRCCVVLNEDEMNVNQHVCIIRTKKDKLSPFFLNYFIRSKVGQTQVDYYQTGGNREGLTGENIKNFKISFPMIQEQQEIVEYLDKHTKEIDDLVSMEQNKIELLKEYRQSLVSEVITGKIKVV